MGAAGYILDPLWTRSGYILHSFWAPSGPILGPFGTCLGPFGVFICGPFVIHSGPIWGPQGLSLGCAAAIMDELSIPNQAPTHRAQEPNTFLGDRLLQPQFHQKE